MIVRVKTTNTLTDDEIKALERAKRIIDMCNKRIHFTTDVRLTEVDNELKESGDSLDYIAKGIDLKTGKIIYFRKSELIAIVG